MSDPKSLAQGNALSAAEAISEALRERELERSNATCVIRGRRRSRLTATSSITEDRGRDDRHDREEQLERSDRIVIIRTELLEREICTVSIR